MKVRDDATDSEIVARLTGCDGRLVPAVLGDADQSDPVDVVLGRDDDGQLVVRETGE